MIEKVKRSSLEDSRYFFSFLLFLPISSVVSDFNYFRQVHSRTGVVAHATVPCRHADLAGCFTSPGQSATQRDDPRSSNIHRQSVMVFTTSSLTTNIPLSRRRPSHSCSIIIVIFLSASYLSACTNGTTCVSGCLCQSWPSTSIARLPTRVLRRL